MPRCAASRQQDEKRCCFLRAEYVFFELLRRSGGARISAAFICRAAPSPFQENSALLLRIMSRLQSCSLYCFSSEAQARAPSGASDFAPPDMQAMRPLLPRASASRHFESSFLHRRRYVQMPERRGASCSERQALRRAAAHSQQPRAPRCEVAPAVTMSAFILRSSSRQLRCITGKELRRYSDFRRRLPFSPAYIIFDASAAYATRFLRYALMRAAFFMMRR